MRDDLNHRFLVEDEKYASNNSVERSNNVSWNKTIHALSIDLGDISIDSRTRSSLSLREEGETVSSHRCTLYPVN